MVSAFIKVGGYSGLQDKYMMAIPNSSIPNTTCGIPREDSFVLLRNAVDSDIPWPGFVLGVTASSIWYWCADQVRSINRGSNQVGTSLQRGQGQTGCITTTGWSYQALLSYLEILLIFWSCPWFDMMIASIPILQILHFLFESPNGPRRDGPYY
jgi:hypothetical protein